MIPKIIHYCWFGRNPLPPLAVKCLESWKKFLPGYEIREWNEDNFDVSCVPYVREAYEEKRYAFVSDYARFWVLYRYGGLYFDTDVEVIRPLEDIIARGPFMGCEQNTVERKAAAGRHTVPATEVAPGLGLGVCPGHPVYRDILEQYADMHFRLEDGNLNKTTIVSYTTEVLRRNGLKDSTELQCCAGIWIYPWDYFCPKDYYTEKLTLTENTVAIHHYSASWHGPKEKLFRLLCRIFGSGFMHRISDTLHGKK